MLFKGASGAKVALHYVVQQAIARPTYFRGVIPQSSRSDQLLARVADAVELEAAASLHRAGAPGPTGGLGGFVRMYERTYVRMYVRMYVYFRIWK